MARRPIRMSDLIAKYGPGIEAAFLDAVGDIRDQAQVARIAERLERGDIDGALRAVGLDPAAFRTFEEAIRLAYTGGGVAAVGGMPRLTDGDGGRVIIRFDARNPRAERWLTEHSSRLVTAIVDDQRTAIRSALNAGMTAGDNSRTTALDIVGRLNRATGKREGGIVGLTSQQSGYVATARAELASGDERLLRHYLTRERRDRRFDRSIMRAIKDGRPLDADTARRAAQSYSNRLLNLRGETIGRTEALASLHESQREAFRQAVDTGTVSPQQVRRIWRTASDSRVRDSHSAQNGESVGLEERFSNGLAYPGEAGAPPGEVINCRCTLEYRVDFLANIR